MTHKRARALDGPWCIEHGRILGPTKDDGWAPVIGQINQSTDVDRANGTLIVAAPELLKTCFEVNRLVASGQRQFPRCFARLLGFRSAHFLGLPCYQLVAPPAPALRSVTSFTAATPLKFSVRNFGQSGLGKFPFFRWKRARPIWLLEIHRGRKSKFRSRIFRCGREYRCA